MTNENKSVVNKRRFRQFIKITFLSILTLGILGLLSGIGYVYYVVKDAPEFNPQAFANLSSTTNVYDRNGEFLGAMQTDGNRELVKSLDEVSPNVVNAFIAAEDKNFKDHMGINPVSIIRAAYQNFIGGGIVSGASTITQQTVKIVMFPAQEQTIQRKLQEMYLALQLEKTLTKDEILVHYLNWIYFGKSGYSNIYGIKAAAIDFFGKDPKELNLAQSALLAGMLNNPSSYNPYTRLEKALEYQDYVLNEMLQTGIISEDQYKEARAFDIKASLVQPKITASGYGNYPFVITEVEQRTAEKLMTVAKYETVDDAKQALFKGGYKVYITVDRQMQDTVDEVLGNNKNFLPNVSYQSKSGKLIENAMQQGGASLLDNSTGGILAMGGGRDYKLDQNNHTTLPRQPGSTMKPIAVYGPAVDKKMLSPSSVIDDVPMALQGSGGTHYPKNADGQFHGLVTVRKALQWSYNIPALKAMEKISPAIGLEYAKKMGLNNLTKQDENLVAGIGGLTYGVTVEEATSAFSTFSNSGVWKESHLITKIVDRNGNTIFEQKPKETQVFSPQTSFILTDMMKDVVRSGTAGRVGARYPNRQIVGKTGTTDDNTDAWFVGITPKVTLGIWVGYDIPKPMNNSEGSRPQTLWMQIMDQIYPKLQGEGSFPGMPGGIVRAEFSTKSGKLPTDLSRELNAVATDYFIAGTEPKEPDDILVKAKYVEINGKKYLLNDKVAAFGGVVKEGIFIKREPYTVPPGFPKPLDADLELPKEYGTASKEGPNLISPSGLKVTDSSAKSVSLSWNAVSGSEGYLVLRSTTPTGPFHVISNVLTDTTYTDTGVETGTTYYYQVSSVTKGVIHPADNIVEVVVGTGGGSNVFTPSGLAAVNTPIGNSISWQPVQGATQYILYRSFDGSTFDTLTVLTDTNYQDAGAGLNSWYKVAAKNGSQTSQPSAPIKVGNDSSNPNLGAPSVSLQNTGNGSLQINWSPVSEAVRYIVQRSTGSSWEQVAETRDTTFTDSNLTAGTTYSYRVYAVNASGKLSVSSNIVQGTP